MNRTNDNPFYIGVCMAGAVSAGAYTAGVMDYLIEALDAWQKRKDEGTPGTPQHQVVIPVLGGASAGGMTAVITAAALHNKLTPVKPGTVAQPQKAHPENKLYHSWVDLAGEDMFSMLLDTGDLEKEVGSLLNSSFIDSVADRAIQSPEQDRQALPPYVHPRLKIFTTLTNLEGFQYNIDMKTGGGKEKYYMSIHNDYACFQLGQVKKESNNAGAQPKSTGWIPLDFTTATNTTLAKDAAMATGAFPIGLQSREVVRSADDVNELEWCRHVLQPFKVQGTSWRTQNVDGGVINNEPFERVRQLLNELTGEDKREDEKGRKAFNNELTFESTVMLIDPFPSEKPKTFVPSQNLFKVMGFTLGAMLGQMRSKPEILANAMDPECSGQFLIAPSRRVPRAAGGAEKDAAGDGAIACGAMGGFAGFVNKEFRMHDYFLGRYNCEQFLRYYFVVSKKALETNPVFQKGYGGLSAEALAKLESKKMPGYYPIIPVFTEAPKENTLPMPLFRSGTNWPVMQAEEVLVYKKAIRKRAQALIMRAAPLKGLEKFLVWIGAKVVLSGLLTKKALQYILNSLDKHELLYHDVEGRWQINVRPFYRSHDKVDHPN